MYDMNQPRVTGGLPGPAAQPQIPAPAMPKSRPKRLYEADARERVLLFLTLGLGTLCADLLLAMWRDYLGLGITALALAWEAVLFWYAKDRPRRAGEKWCPRLLTAAVVLLALTFTLYSDRWLWNYNTLALPVLMAVQMLECFGPARRPWRDPVMLLERLWLVVEGLFWNLGAPGKAVASFGKGGGKRRWLYVLLGLAAAVPVLLVVVPLLSAADPVFQRLAGNAVNFLVDHFGSLVLRLVLGLCAAPFLFSLLYALRRPEPVKEGTKPPKTFPGLDPALCVTALAVLDGVYLLFVAVQSAALFGGEAYLAGTGMSYAEYARSGFFQLVWVSCVNLAVVVPAIHFSRRTGRLWPVLRVLSTGMVVLSGVMLASAAWRMTLYVGSYGLSFKRFLTYWGMVMLCVFFTGALLKIWKKEFGFFQVLLAASIAGWLVLNFINVDYQVARYNVNAYLTGNTAVMDLPYLASLSYDTLGQLARMDGRAPVYHDPDLSGYVLDTLLADRRESAAGEISRWETWTLSGWLAARGA